jgi:hypothetical protein
MIFLAVPALPPVGATSAAAIMSVTASQQQIIERIKQQQPASSFKVFGQCSYDWNQWKLSPEGIRSTKRLCKHEIEDIVAVSCSILKTNTFEDGKWGQWRSPLAKDAKPGEGLMVAALCANITP